MFCTYVYKYMFYIFVVAMSQKAIVVFPIDRSCIYLFVLIIEHTCTVKGFLVNMLNKH